MKTPAGILSAMVLLSLNLVAQDRATLIESILNVPAWNAISEPAVYDEGTIDALTGENTPNVLEYGLVGATRIELEGPDGQIEATFYEMIDSSASFGLFTLERDWQSSDFELAVVGAESFRNGTRLSFWQSRYVVNLEGSREATAALGELLADRIEGQSRKAPVSLFLPSEGLVRESEQYLLTPDAFARATGLDPAELGFGDSVEVALADYRHSGGIGRLAMLLYPTQQLASVYADAWLANHRGQLPSRKSGPLFAILIGGDSTELEDSTLSALNYQSEVTWTETLPDPLTLPQLILTIFAFIGIALAFTLVVGLMFGGFRIYMKTRYPNSIFGGRDDVEFIELKLNQSVTRKQLPS